MTLKWRIIVGYTKIKKWILYKISKWKFQRTSKKFKKDLTKYEQFIFQDIQRLSNQIFRDTCYIPGDTIEFRGETACNIGKKLQPFLQNKFVNLVFLSHGYPVSEIRVIGHIGWLRVDKKPTIDGSIPEINISLCDQEQPPIVKAINMIDEREIK